MAARAFAEGERRAGALLAPVREEVTRVSDSIDYVDANHADSLVPYGPDERVHERALVAIACRIGKTRLLDNVVLGEDPLESLTPKEAS